MVNRTDLREVVCNGVYNDGSIMLVDVNAKTSYHIYVDDKRQLSELRILERCLRPKVKIKALIENNDITYICLSKSNKLKVDATGLINVTTIGHIKPQDVDKGEFVDAVMYRTSSSLNGYGFYNVIVGNLKEEPIEVRVMDVDLNSKVMSHMNQYSLGGILAVKVTKNREAVILSPSLILSTYRAREEVKVAVKIQDVNTYLCHVSQGSYNDTMKITIYGADIKEKEIIIEHSDYLEITPRILHMHKDPIAALNNVRITLIDGVATEIHIGREVTYKVKEITPRVVEKSEPLTITNIKNLTHRVFIMTRSDGKRFIVSDKDRKDDTVLPKALKADHDIAKQAPNKIELSMDSILRLEYGDTLVDKEFKVNVFEIEEGAEVTEASFDITTNTVITRDGTKFKVSHKDDIPSAFSFIKLANNKGYYIANAYDSNVIIKPNLILLKIEETKPTVLEIGEFYRLTARVYRMTTIGGKSYVVCSKDKLNDMKFASSLDHFTTPDKVTLTLGTEHELSVVQYSSDGTNCMKLNHKVHAIEIEAGAEVFDVVYHKGSRTITTTFNGKPNGDFKTNVTGDRLPTSFRYVKLANNLGYCVINPIGNEVTIMDNLKLYTEVPSTISHIEADIIFGRSRLYFTVKFKETGEERHLKFSRYHEQNYDLVKKHVSLNPTVDCRVRLENNRIKFIEIKQPGMVLGNGFLVTEVFPKVKEEVKSFPDDRTEKVELLDLKHNEYFVVKLKDSDSTRYLRFTQVHAVHMSQLRLFKQMNPDGEYKVMLRNNQVRMLELHDPRSSFGIGLPVEETEQAPAFKSVVKEFEDMVKENKESKDNTETLHGVVNMIYKGSWFYLDNNNNTYFIGPLNGSMLDEEFDALIGCYKKSGSKIEVHYDPDNIYNCSINLPNPIHIGCVKVDFNIKLEGTLENRDGIYYLFLDSKEPTLVSSSSLKKELREQLLNFPVGVEVYPSEKHYVILSREFGQVTIINIDDVRDRVDATPFKKVEGDRLTEELRRNIHQVIDYANDATNVSETIDKLIEGYIELSKCHNYYNGMEKLSRDVSKSKLMERSNKSCILKNNTDDIKEALRDQAAKDKGHGSPLLQNMSREAYNKLVTDIAAGKSITIPNVYKEILDEVRELDSKKSLVPLIPKRTVKTGSAIYVHLDIENTYKMNNGDYRATVVTLDQPYPTFSHIGEPLFRLCMGRVSAHSGTSSITEEYIKFSKVIDDLIGENNRDDNNIFFSFAAMDKLSKIGFKFDPVKKERHFVSIGRSRERLTVQCKSITYLSSLALKLLTVLSPEDKLYPSYRAYINFKLPQCVNQDVTILHFPSDNIRVDELTIPVVVNANGEIVTLDMSKSTTLYQYASGKIPKELKRDIKGIINSRVYFTKGFIDRHKGHSFVKIDREHI